MIEKIIVSFQQNNFCNQIKEKYNVNPQFEFSKCSMEYGWNIKFKHRNKNLCTIYPREHYFCVMIVISKKDQNMFEKKLPYFCKEIQEIVKETKEWNGQKWLMIELEDYNQKYEDVKQIIEIKQKNF